MLFIPLIYIYCVIRTAFINLCLVKYKHRNNIDSASVEILITIHDLSPPPATHVMLVLLTISIGIKQFYF